jgi:hypothetical protein
MDGGRAFNDLGMQSSLALRQRFHKRGLVADAADQLARAMAGGLNLNWWDLREDSRGELRGLAGEILQRLGRVPT